MTAAITYDLLHEDAATGARAGILHTPHGSFETPIFMPVGTQATVKGVSPDELREMGVADVRQDDTYGYVYAAIPSNCPELITVPSARKASFRSFGSTSGSSGAIVGMISSPNFFAKSKSRWS